MGAWEKEEGKWVRGREKRRKKGIVEEKEKEKGGSAY